MAERRYDPHTDVETMFLSVIAADASVATAHYPVKHWHDITKTQPLTEIRVGCQTTVSRSYPNNSPYIEMALVIIAVRSPRNSDVDGGRANQVLGWVRRAMQSRTLWQQLTDVGTEYKPSILTNHIRIMGTEIVDSDSDFWQRNMTLELAVYQSSSSCSSSTSFSSSSTSFSLSSSSSSSSSSVSASLSSSSSSSSVSTSLSSSSSSSSTSVSLSSSSSSTSFSLSSSSSSSSVSASLSSSSTSFSLSSSSSSLSTSSSSSSSSVSTSVSSSSSSSSTSLSTSLSSSSTSVSTSSSSISLSTSLSSSSSSADPTDLSAYSPWIDLDFSQSDTITLNGAKIITIVDRNGNGRSATQAVDGNRFSIAAGVRNGNDVCRGDALGVKWLVFPDMSSLTAGQVFMTVEMTNATSAVYNTLWEFGGADFDQLYPWNSDSHIYEEWGTTARKDTGDPTPALDAWQLYMVQSSNNLYTTWLNNVQEYTTATNTVQFISAPRLGGNGGATTGLDGDVGRIVIFDTPLSAGNRAAVAAILKEQWDTP